jgi:hypothetical protein
MANTGANDDAETSSTISSHWTVAVYDPATSWQAVPPAGSASAGTDLQPTQAEGYRNRAETRAHEDVLTIQLLADRIETLERKLTGLTTAQQQDDIAYGELKSQLRSMNDHISDLEADNRGLREDAVVLGNRSQWMHDLEMEKQKKDAKHRMVVTSWPNRHICSEEDRIRVQEWIMTKFREKVQQQEDISWQHSYFDGTHWKMLAISYIKFDSEEDRANFAKWAYKNYSGRNPLTYWDESDHTINHTGTNTPHRIVIAPFLTKIERIQGLPLQVCSYVLTQGEEDAPYRNNKTLSIRKEECLLYDRDQKQVICKTKYNSSSGCITISVVPEWRQYIATRILKNWTATHEHHPSFRHFRDFPYTIDFNNLVQAAWRPPANKGDAKGADKGSKGGKGEKGKGEDGKGKEATTGKGSEEEKGKGHGAKVGKDHGKAGGTGKGQEEDPWQRQSEDGSKGGQDDNEDRKNFRETSREAEFLAATGNRRVALPRFEDADEETLRPGRVSPRNTRGSSSSSSTR